MARICLVTPSHVASNPRLVKEADALHAVGHTVHVVAHRYYPVIDAQDAAIYSQARWTRTVVDFTRGPGPRWAKLRRRFIRLAISRGLRITAARAACAHHAAVPALISAAVRFPADLYIGHCLAGLAAAAGAARRTGARHGFDAEDFHSAETRETEESADERALITALERACLPSCSTFTAASPLIARAYRETYNLRMEPVPVLNVFPLSQAPSVAPSCLSPGSPLRLYWFSQTIGAGRGLEALVTALGRMTTPVSLHLRGLPAPGFREILQTLAKTRGWRGQIEFLPFGHADEMPRLAAGYDLGLSLEQRIPRNRDLCLTNKIFTYLLAGLPVALSATSAQDALRPELGDAALSLLLEDPEACADTLDSFARSAARRATARAAAWHLGQTRFNWDREQTIVQQIVTNSGFPAEPSTA